MNKYRSILLMILIIISTNAYCKNCGVKDSVFCNLKMNKIEELSFRMSYFTRPKRWDYGYVHLDGCLKEGKLSLYLLELKRTSEAEKAIWVKYPIKLSTEGENSLLKKIDALFVSKTVQPVLSIIERNSFIYEDRNILQIITKKKGIYERNDYEFQDYSQKQINETEDVVYSPQMITLFKTIEDIIKTKVEELQVITIKDNGKNI